MNEFELLQEVTEKTRKHINTRIDCYEMKMKELMDAKNEVTKPQQAAEKYALDAKKQVERETSALENHLKRRKEELYTG